MPECYSVYLFIFSICASPEGCFQAPTGGKYPNCPPNRGIPSKSFVLVLNVQPLALATHACINCASTTVGTFVYMYELKFVL